MPVLNRAELSRTGMVFVALLFAICATGAVAREFRAADTQSEDDPTVQALRYMQQSGLTSEMIRSLGAEPVEDAMAPIYAKSACAAAALIERLRKVE